MENNLAIMIAKVLFYGECRKDFLYYLPVGVRERKGGSSALV